MQQKSIWRPLLLCALLAGPCGQALAERPAVTPYLQFGSASYSEAFTIKGLINELSGPLSEGDHAFSFNQLETGVRYDGIELAAFIRNDYFAAFTPDTARLFYQGENGLPVDPGFNYDVSLRLHHIRSRGIGFGIRFDPTDSLTLKPRLNLLLADKLTDGFLAGEVMTDHTGRYSTRFAVDYAYSADKLFKRVVAQEPEGRGFSFDIDGHWQLSDSVALRLAIKDLFGRVRWDNAPFTAASADTDNVRLDADGYIDTSPLLSGLESNKHHTQSLPTRYWLGVSKQLTEQLQLGAELFRVSGLNFPRAHLSWHFYGHELSASFDARAEAFGLAYRNGACHAALSSDSLEPDEAHSFGLQLGCRLAF